MTNLELLFARIEALATHIGNSVQLRGFKLGGTAGQVPTKVNGSDFNWTWQNPPTGNTNLTFSRTSTTVTVVSDTGTDAILPAADSSNAGVLTSADKVKLDGFASPANYALLAGATFTGPVSATNLSGTNTGDQTSIVGITGTIAQFNTALTDGDFATTASLSGYQPLDSDLTSWAAITRGVGFDGAAAIAVGSPGAFLLNNGSAASLTGLSLTTGVTGVLPVANGGTGVSISGTTSQILVGGGTTSPAVWTTATGTGAPVRASSPSLTTPSIGDAQGTSLLGFSSITGSASSNMTITAGTGASKIMTFRTTTSGSTVTDAMTIGATQRVTVLSTEASSSSTTGALVVAGGVGVAGDVNVATPGTNTTSVVTNSTGDVRYGQIYVLNEPGITSVSHTVWTNSAVQITLPAGSYVYEGLTACSTASTTAGVQTSLTATITGTGVGEGLQYRGANFFSLNTLAGHFYRVTTASTLENIPECNAPQGGAKFACTPSKGFFTIASPQTFGYRVRQETATDAVNAATLGRSYIVFRKIA